MVSGGPSFQTTLYAPESDQTFFNNTPFGGVASIPFSFEVNGHQFAAGNYNLAPENSGSAPVYGLHSASSNSLLPAHYGESRDEASGNYLVFFKQGDKYTLVEAHKAGYKSFMEFTRQKQEAKLQERGVGEMVKVKVTPSWL